MEKPEMNQVARISEKQVFEAITKGDTYGAVAMLRYIAQEHIWSGMIVNDVVKLLEDDGQLPRDGIPDDNWLSYWECDVTVPKELSLKYRDEMIKRIQGYVLEVSLVITDEGRCKMHFVSVGCWGNKHEVLGNLKYTPNTVHYEIQCLCKGPGGYPIASEVQRLVSEALRRQMDEHDDMLGYDYVVDEYSFDEEPPMIPIRCPIIYDDSDDDEF